MAERPILFTGDMVRAILDGRKTETRRLVTKRESTGPETVWDHRLPGTPSVPGWENLDFDAHICGPACDEGDHRGYCCCLVDGDAAGDGQYIHVPAKDHETRHRVRCRTMPGDVLYVRETFWQSRTRGYMAEWGEWTGGDWTRARVVYDSEPANKDVSGREYMAVRPSIHMPKWASRIRLRVTEVRAERLQEIDQAGARAEGIVADYSAGETDRHLFACLWDSIYKADKAWAANPWVWRIIFEIAEVKT